MFVKLMKGNVEVAQVEVEPARLSTTTLVKYKDEYYAFSCFGGLPSLPTPEFQIAEAPLDLTNAPVWKSATKVQK